MTTRGIRFLIWSLSHFPTPSHSFRSQLNGYLFASWKKTSLINFSLHKFQSWYNSRGKEFKFKVILCISSCSTRALISVGLYTSKIEEYFCHRMDIQGWIVHVRECLERDINSSLPSAYQYCLRTSLPLNHPTPPCYLFPSYPTLHFPTPTYSAQS